MRRKDKRRIIKKRRMKRVVVANINATWVQSPPRCQEGSGQSDSTLQGLDARVYLLIQKIMKCSEPECPLRAKNPDLRSLCLFLLRFGFFFFFFFFFFFCVFCILVLLFLSIHVQSAKVDSRRFLSGQGLGADDLDRWWALKPPVAMFGFPLVPTRVARSRPWS